MPNLGVPELILILVIALIIFGPKKLPSIGESIGKTVKEFQKAFKEISEGTEEESESKETEK